MIKIFFISVITLYVNLFANEVKVIDVKANAKTASEKARKIDISKTTTNTLLTEDIVTKINNFYIV